MLRVGSRNRGGRPAGRPCCGWLGCCLRLWASRWAAVGGCGGGVPREGRVRVGQVAAAVGCGWWLRAGGDRSGGGVRRSRALSPAGSGAVRTGGWWRLRAVGNAVGCRSAPRGRAERPPAAAGPGPPPQPPARRHRHQQHPAHRPKGGAAATPYGVRRSRAPSTPHTARRPAAPDDHPPAAPRQGAAARCTAEGQRPTGPAGRPLRGQARRGPAGEPAPAAGSATSSRRSPQYRRHGRAPTAGAGRSQER